MSGGLGVIMFVVESYPAASLGAPGGTLRSIVIDYYRECVFIAVSCAK